MKTRRPRLPLLDAVSVLGAPTYVPSVLHWATRTFPFKVLGTPMAALGALPLQVNAVEFTASTRLEES